MSRPLALTERQVVALCRGAAKAGHIAVVEIDGLLVRFLPENHKSLQQADRPIDAANDDDLDAEWSAFEAKHGDG